MRVALFIPCYVDQLRPEVGLAALDVLEALGIEVAYPEDQTCCGQPFQTAGETGRARALGDHFVDVFDGFDRIVSLSGSCAATIRRHLPAWLPGRRAEEVARRTLEFCEFLLEQGGLDGLQGRFPHRVGLHASCHALRELRLGTPSETREPPRPDPAASLLDRIDGLERVDLARRDECCGFGGLFSVEEEAVSTRMGLDRLADHGASGSEIIASSDVSCLLHLEGLAKKRGMPFRTMHIAEILASSLTEQSERSPAAPRPIEEDLPDGPR